MKRFDWRILGGIALIVVGILLLLQGFGIFRFLVGFLWVFLFCAAGVTFLFVFLTDRTHWWAPIPGFALLGLAGTIFFEQVIRVRGGTWGGAIFMGMLSLGFWLIYLTGSERWWAVIPGGVILTIALVTGVSSIVTGTAVGGVFFVGLGLTFGLLAIVPTPEGRQKWALIPAGVLLALGLLLLFAPILRYLWPVALILIGLYVVLRAFGVLRRW